MCLSPNKLPDGTQVACRVCRLCLSNRVNDLVGRCLAEQAVSDGAYSVTLTYAQDHANSAVLCYEDVQLFLKRLRKDGFKVRYICAGEYGTVKGRAHWHIVLFFRGKLPEVEMDKRFNWSFWPHGFVYFQRPDYGGFRYAMKYALKSQTAGAVKALSMSKKPPLGHRFFMEMADDLVARGLSLHSPEYSFMHARDSKGLFRKFWLQGRMREMFIDRYKIMWRMRYGEDPPYTDFYMERYEDKIERRRKDFGGNLERDLEAKRPKRVYIVPDYEAERSLGYLMIGDGGMITAISGPNGRLYATLWWSDQEWIIESASGKSVAERLQARGLSLARAKLVSAWLLERWGLPPETWLSGRNV